ncbi:MAG: protein kinase [Polyangiaceae bacterium]|nr:protein kinase [Polyangiaceae bacterium]
MSEARTLANIAINERPDLAKYDLLDELGHGGMATVYRAHDRRLDREVAVKIIHRHLRENAEVAARFTSEAKAVAKLRHPNIVEVYDVSDEAEGERYLVVELVRGTTLRRVLTEHEYLPPEIAAIIAVEIGEALAHAHEHGVIHRDVKPENVLVDLDRPRLDRESERPSDRRSRIKLTDFGIAKLLDAQGVTSTGQVLGSPAHMSPEQIEGGTVTVRSDVFGLGVLLYESLVGVLPFEGKNPAQVLRRVLEGTFTPAERARPTVGVAFGRITSRALAHSPEDRYPTISDLTDALRVELERMGFSDLRRELEEFLGDSVAYVPHHAERVVARLVEIGRRARSERMVPLAAACFNRALAYRPDDLELLRLVSGLAKAERLRRNVRHGAVAVTVLLGLTGAAVGLPRWLSSSQTVPSPRASTRPVSGPDMGLPEEPAAVASAKRTPPRPLATRPRRAASPRPVAPFAGIKSTPRAQQLRRPVKVVISGGAIGGYVVVDGARLASGDSRELSIGQEYSFEFRPPDANKDCCTATTKNVEITESTTVVSATVPFYPATIVASRAPLGTTIDCGMLGTGTTPSAMKVTFNNDPQIPVTCSLVPPPQSGLPPHEKSATLTPAAVVDLWP